MKYFILLLFVSCLFTSNLEAQWWNCCQGTPRYYNPNWMNDGLYYGYTDINAYPYALPVNYTFNPRPCRNCDFDYTIRVVEQPATVRPHCHNYHD